MLQQFRTRTSIFVSNLACIPVVCIPGALPPESAGEGDLWVKTLGPPGQFLLLCSEDLLQLL